ncbi:MAG: hypothetical protein QWI36_00050 [Wolbachia endosymbiont of Tyrophagus putrescentiae]|nr:hypothetical protein [Wolbachia endosymbiont of Tyrophagus putrescentiae]
MPSTQTQVLKEKLESLILAIQGGDFDSVKKALEGSKENGCKQSSVINLKNKDGMTPLHVALEQYNIDLKIINLLLDSGIDIKYCYSNPLDKIRKELQGDNYLHIAARAGNVDAFLLIYKKSVEDGFSLLGYNDNHENPFHIAASRVILPDVIRKIFEYLKSREDEEGKKIKKAKEAKNEEGLKNSEIKKEEFNSERKFVKNALYAKKEYALNNQKRTPLSLVSEQGKRKIKETVGIKDSLVRSKRLHLCLYIVGALACIAAFCLSLHLLYITAQAFALSTIASAAVGGVAFFGAKACSEVHDFCGNGTDIEGVVVTSTSIDSGLGTA